MCILALLLPFIPPGSRDPAKIKLMSGVVISPGCSLHR